MSDTERAALLRENATLKAHVVRLSLQIDNMSSCDGVTTNVLQPCEPSHWNSKYLPGLQPWGTTDNPYYQIDQVAEALGVSSEYARSKAHRYVSQCDAIVSGELMSLTVVPLGGLLGLVLTCNKPICYRATTGMCEFFVG